MSNVYKRFRGETPTQFEINAIKLQTLVAKFCVKEKFMPKKYRLLLGIPLVNKSDELMDNIVFANSIYVTNEREATLRKSYQTKAIACCYQLQNLIVKLESTVDTVKIENLEEIIETLCQERLLLLAWRNSEKVVPPKQKIPTYHKPPFK